MGVSWLALGCAVLVVLGVSAVHAVVGFAFGLLSTPVLLFLFPPKEVVVLTVLLMLVLNPLIVLPAWRAVETRLLRPLLFPMALGLPIGAFALAVVSPLALRFLIGSALVAVATLLLVGWRPRGVAGAGGAALAGFAGGILTTSINFNGPPVALYLTSRGLGARAFRATIATYLFCAHVLGVLVFVATGLLTVVVAALAAGLAPVCLAGYWLGSRWRARLDEQRFTRLVLGLLALMGAVTATSAAYLR